MSKRIGKSVVGLNIEPGYVAAVQTAAGGVAVEQAATAALPAGVVREGEVNDIETLAAVLKTMFAEHKLARKVRIGIANQRIVMRTIELPPLKDAKQLASAIRFQAQDHIPMPLDQAVLEHHLLGTVETPEGPRARVVLVAARRDMILSLLEAARRAGLRPQGIDLSAFAMIRALHQPGSDERTLYLSVGGMTNLAIAQGSTCVFTRTIGLGTEGLATELAERRGLTLDHAHAWLRHVGLEAPIEDLEGDPAIIEESRHILVDGARRIADEVRNTLDFHRAQSASEGVSGAVLTGPAVAIPGFSDSLARDIDVPLQARLALEARPGAFGAVDPALLAVAAGLTLEEIPA
jgi:type IV pilus assembly protein PilM